MGKERRRREEGRQRKEERKEQSEERSENMNKRRREIRLDEMKAEGPGPGSK